MILGLRVLAVVAVAAVAAVLRALRASRAAIRLARLLAGCAAAACLLFGVGAAAQVRQIDRMLMLVADDTTPPSVDRAWISVALPVNSGSDDVPDDAPDNGPDAASGRQGAAWYRVAFDRASIGAGTTCAVYLPYLYDGGQVWVNGEFVRAIPESSAALRVRWERPHLIVLPTNLLRLTGNVLDIRVAAVPAATPRRLPRIDIGPEVQLLPRYDARLFLARTMPQFTVLVCLLAAGCVLFIWWRRRSEVLYGLFGLAAALWGIRTLTFVIEVVPADRWLLWRIAYLAATGGFIVVMALFALRFAGIRRVWAERGLLAYWVAGPLWLALHGQEGEAVVNRYWTAGLIPIGLSILVISLRSVWLQRTLAAAVIPLALVIAVIAGVVDYLVSWDVGIDTPLWSLWASQRIFLLHHAANLLLLAMGGVLTARFIHTLSALEDLNHTLESRVADRERHLADNFSRLSALQEQHAASKERQLIMREIHDGLGSRLFTSLLRVERGDIDRSQVAETLRDCIADMRLALDALAPDNDDFRTAIGNFLFRWQTQLEEAHIRTAWTIDVPESGIELSSQAALQLLRIAQEALTNVLKHSRAGKVRIGLKQTDGMLELEVIDDGCGRGDDALAAIAVAEGPAPRTGRGLVNMRTRAAQLGGELEVHHGTSGTRVLLRVPMKTVGQPH